MRQSANVSRVLVERVSRAIMAGSLPHPLLVRTPAPCALTVMARWVSDTGEERAAQIELEPEHLGGLTGFLGLPADPGLARAIVGACSALGKGPMGLGDGWTLRSLSTVEQRPRFVPTMDYSDDVTPRCIGG